MRRWLVAHRAELLTALTWVAGYALVGAGIGALVTAQWVRAVYAILAGLLLISLGGWRLLWTVATHGLYTLTRGDRK